MRIVALLSVRNEGLYIKRCLEHLESQGIETCLIDNGSTDGTLEIANDFSKRGVFRIEHLPFNGIFEWEKHLCKKEKLAMEIQADWFISHDADEIREAPKPFNTLKEGMEDADNRGFNAINFDEFVFLPTTTDGSFEGKDYVNEMKYYYLFKPRPLHRLNAWKKTKYPVDLVSNAGHSVAFQGIKICPTPFIMRHYILLSRAHATNKYGSRKFPIKELNKGWHGERAGFSQDKLDLSDINELKMISKNGVWDKADPWKKHKFFGPQS